MPSPKELWVTTTWTLPPETLASSRANQGSWDGEMAGPPGQHTMAFKTICSSSSLRGICSEPAREISIWKPKTPGGSFPRKVHFSLPHSWGVCWRFKLICNKIYNKAKYLFCRRCFCLNKTPAPSGHPPHYPSCLQTANTQHVSKDTDDSEAFLSVRVCVRCSPKRARYCKVSRIIVSTQRSWLVLRPNVSRVFSVSWLLL